ncbi:MAG: hypothetical protein HRT35_35970, partial [Algicola sp.]|nr:hypothetical protein [Algicola sp.]
GSGTGYPCIKSVDIHLRVMMRNGLLPSDFDVWADDIVAAVTLLLEGHIEGKSEGLLQGKSTGQGDNIRYYSDEAQYLAAFCVHLLRFGRACDWPFEPCYQPSLSVADNLVAKLQMKAALLPKIIQWMPHYFADGRRGIERFFLALGKTHCTQLLKSMGCSANPGLMIFDDLALEGSLDTLGHILANLGRFELERCLLVLVLMPALGKGKGYEYALPLSETRWQSLYTFARLLQWLKTEATPEQMVSMHKTEPVKIDNRAIQVLYQVCCNETTTKQRFVAQLRWAHKLLGVIDKTAALISAVIIKGEGNDTSDPVDNQHSMLSGEKVEVRPSAKTPVDLNKPPSINEVEVDVEVTVKGQTSEGASPDEPLQQAELNPPSAGSHTFDNPAAVPSSEAEQHGITHTAKHAPKHGGHFPFIRKNAVKETENTLDEAMNYAGLSLVLAALMRHPRADLLSETALWMLCCYAVPKDLRPLVFSDQGLRLLCLGTVPWEDASDLCARVKADARFKVFCELNDLTDLEQQLPQWSLRHFSQYMTGFDGSTSDNLFKHFIHYPGRVCIDNRAVRCRVNKPPLVIVISMSALFNQQPSLPAWPDRPWYIQWKN